MLDRARIVLEHRPLAHAEPSALGDDDAARLQRFGGLFDRLPPARHRQVRVPRRELLDQPVDPRFEIAARDRRPHRRGEDRRRQHFVERAGARPHHPRELEDVGARVDVAIAGGDRRAEGDERARSVAHGVAHHFGHLAAERALPPLHALVREDVILEHQIVGDGDGDDHQVRPLGFERGVEQAGFRRLQLAAVAAPALGVEEQVVLLEDLGDVGLERDQVGRVFRRAAQRDRAGQVLVDQAERAAEQVDAGDDQRRPDAVVVEHQRLDQVVAVALVVRRVDDAVAADRVGDVVQVLVLALDLAQNRVERVLQRAVELVPLRGPQLFEVGADLLARVLEHVLARQNGLRDLVQHLSHRDYSTN